MKANNRPIATKPNTKKAGSQICRFQGVRSMLDPPVKVVAAIASGITECKPRAAAYGLL